MSEQQTAYIDVSPSHMAIAFIWALFKPQYCIDGGPPQAARWGSNVVPVTPGQHRVEVWCPYLFWTRSGFNTIDVTAPPASVKIVAPLGP